MTIFLGPAVVIRWIYRPDTYRMRASIDDVLAAIDARPPLSRTAH